MPGLDGLRALSVLAVIAYHLNISWAPGGLLGVSIFFTLSGYLITDQLISQWQHTRRIDLKDFWVRRIRRLMPAMFFMMAVVVAWLLIFDRSRLEALQGDFISAVLYVNNWWLIFHDVSYFESFGPPSPIGHLWSLAIEEQFYIIWPLLLALALKFVQQRGKILLFILLGALVSALTMAFVYEPGLDPSRVYYGTDTRAFALLAGAALAVVWPSRNLSDQVSANSRLLLNSIGGVGLIIMIWTVFNTTGYSDFLYYGGLGLFAVLSAVVTAALAHPASLIGNIMGIKPLRWIGMRSYSLYLWHFPVIILTTPAVHTGGISIGRAIVQICLTFLLSSISWRFVEEPIRRGTWRKGWHKLNGSLPFKLQYGLIGVSVLVFILLVSVYSGGLNFAKQSSNDASVIVHVPEKAGSSSQPTTQPEHPITSEQPSPTEKPAQTDESTTSDASSPTTSSQPVGTKQPDEVQPNVTNELDKTQPDDTRSDGTEPEPTPEDTDQPEETEQPTEQPSKTDSPQIKPGKGITVIGDSVILDVAPHLEKLLPGIVVDGKVGRQMSQAQEVVDRLKEAGTLQDQVIIELGTNGAFSKKQLRKLLLSLEDVKQVLVVNTRVPREWQDTVNATIEQVVGEFSNARVIDWYSASKDKDTFFADDGVHLKVEGAKFYAALLSQAIR